jgi:hypothetical protein
MTVSPLALWQTGTDSQKLARLAQGAHLLRPMATFAGGEIPTTGGGSHGVVGTSDLQVTGTTLALSVAPGSCFINGTSSVDQGCYFGYSSTTLTVNLAAYNTNPRIDFVVAQAQDNAEDSSGQTRFQIVAITGTPAASPTAPTIPAGCLVLARVNVPANSGAPTITDRRVWAASIGGLHRVTSATKATGAAAAFGEFEIEADTGHVTIHSGTAHMPFGGVGPWRTASILGAAQGATSVTVASVDFRYFQIGKFVSAHLVLQFTSTGTSGQPIALNTSLPAPRATQSAGTFFYNDAGSAFHGGNARISTGGSLDFFSIDKSGVVGGFGVDPVILVTNGDTIDVTITYEAA